MGLMGSVVKFVFDLLVSVVALTLLSPLYAVLAVAVKLDSPGPILYRQQRIGRNGRSFTLLKLRTMVVGADRLSANVTPLGDPRVTRTGRFLRAWYLDELPQLLNVIKGDMSLVGPRPETPEFVAEYTPEERRILSVRPGLVGPSTIGFMDEGEILAASGDPEAAYITTVLHERARLDLGYIDRRSFGGDVALLVRQLLLIVRQREPAA
jgi:lipopolysaccharide/colanic/teichoic acid biosynthesis glycosyltransferase